MLLILIFSSTLIVSLISILAIFLFLKSGLYKKIERLISLAAGVLLAVVWLDIIPETLNDGLAYKSMGVIVLLTILVLFLIETIFHWHHCRHGNCADESHKHLIWFNLFGDGLHNFIDGVILATTFMVDARLGLITTVAVIAHEIPQELSDAGVLSYAGLSIKKIYCYNFLFAATAIIGATLAYFFASEWNVAPYLLSIAAGNFIYLAMADLIPLLHHETDNRKIAGQAAWFAGGILLIYVLGLLAAE